MAKMLEFLQKKYPNTVSKFVAYVIYEKYIDIHEFENMDFGSRYVIAKEFFGYQKRYDIDMTVEEIQKHIISLFEDYEMLGIKYPLGVPNFLKILNSMSNAEKTEYLEKNYKSTTVISLHHALCPRTHFNEPSLKDALMPRNIPMIEQIAQNRLDVAREEQEFWEAIKKEFKVREKLAVPF